MDHLYTTDVIIIIGDWNAIMGDEKLEDITGGHTEVIVLKQELSREIGLFSLEKELVANTILKHHKRRLYRYGLVLVTDTETRFTM